MSYLSTTENVGFSGIPQNMSDTSCATQFKMAVNGLESVPGNCAEAMYTPESPRDDQTYISNLNDNFYTKFKIDPNELYTFHDSDVIAGEITVSHTEDAFVFAENDSLTPDVLNSPKSEMASAFSNGDFKEVKTKILSNGHYNSIPKQTNQKDVKNLHTKIQKAKILVKDIKKEPLTEAQVLSVRCPKVEACMSPPSTVSSINSNTSNAQSGVSVKQASSETFLDVFKREQGLVEDSTVTVKTEPIAPSSPVPSLMQAPMSPPKKINSVSGKTPSSSKPRRGRGPAMHEALQRISRRAIPMPIKKWHAPGEFDCGPLSSKKPAFRTLDSSSSDDEELPDIEIGSRPLCIEEIAAESRSARLDFRREAMRKRLETTNKTLRLAKRHTKAKALCSIVKKQLNSGSSSLPPQTVNHLLKMRGIPSLFTSDERRTLRESGWSGGESGLSVITEICSEDACLKPSVPCARYCLAHITLAPEQRLYASCAAVFAVGSRCNYPLLPLKDQLPLCAEHAWKRDNYDKLIRDNKPKKVVRPRMLSGARRPKRRRRPPPPPPLTRPCARTPPPLALSQSLSEINVCSNSSAYDSSEDTHMGVLSENEYAAASYPHELEVEVVHDILDPSVLSQMPDEAFTEFLNQGIVLEESGTFGESSELAAALEAVLDERGLDERELDDRELDGRELDDGELEETVLEDETLHTMDESMFVESPDASVDKIKMHPASVSMELSTSASS